MINNRLFRYVIYWFYSLVFSLSVAVGQTYDPQTGELIISGADTIKTKTSELPQQFDPFTGEPISLEKSDPVVQLVQSDSTQSSPVETATSNLLTPEEICKRAETDALNNTSNMWFLGGIVYFIGPPLYFLSPPQPPVELLLALEKDQMLSYSDCYTKAAKEIRAKRMLTGCGLYIGLVLVLGT